MARKLDGTVIAWGSPDYGGGASAVDLTDVVDSPFGSTTCVAHKSDGTAIAWGASFGGGDASGADLTNVVDISCGNAACVALKADSTAEASDDFRCRWRRVKCGPHQLGRLRSCAFSCAD